MMDEDTRYRFSAVISMSYELINRLDSTIIALNGQNGMLLGFAFGILSIETGVAAVLAQLGLVFGLISGILFISFAVIILSCIILSLYIFNPTEYKELSLFDKSRFSEVMRAPEEDLLGDFVYHMKELYGFNNRKYESRLWFYRTAFYLFSVSCVMGFLTIIVMLIWRL